jgi:hypothetical protein
LKTSTAAQIQELLKYDGQWEWFVAKNDKGVESRNIMLWWFVPLLDMKIMVQLEKKQTSVAEDVEVRFKMQEKQIAELQAEHKTELTKLRDEHSATVKKLVKDFSAEIVKLQSQFDRMALRNKRMVIHFEMQGDKLKVSYEDKSPEATRAYNAYMEYMSHSEISYHNQALYWSCQSKSYYDKEIPDIIKRFELKINSRETLYFTIGAVTSVNELSSLRIVADPFNTTVHKSFIKGNSGYHIYIDINYHKFEYRNFRFDMFESGKSANDYKRYQPWNHCSFANDYNKQYSPELSEYIAKSNEVRGFGQLRSLNSHNSSYKCVIIYTNRIMDE